MHSLDSTFPSSTVGFCPLDHVTHTTNSFSPRSLQIACSTSQRNEDNSISANLKARLESEASIGTADSGEIESMVMSAVRRLSTEELQKMIQEQLSNVIKRNKYCAWLEQQVAATDAMAIKYQNKIEELQKQVNDLTLVISNYTKEKNIDCYQPPAKLIRNVGLQVRAKPAFRESPRSSIEESESSSPSGTLGDFAVNQSSQVESTTCSELQYSEDTCELKIESVSSLREPSPIGNDSTSNLHSCSPSIDIIECSNQARRTTSRHEERSEIEIDLTLSDNEPGCPLVTPVSSVIQFANQCSKNKSPDVSVLPETFSSILLPDSPHSVQTCSTPSSRSTENITSTDALDPLSTSVESNPPLTNVSRPIPLSAHSLASNDYPASAGNFPPMPTTHATSLMQRIPPLLRPQTGSAFLPPLNGSFPLARSLSFNGSFTPSEHTALPRIVEQRGAVPAPRSAPPLGMNAAAIPGMRSIPLPSHNSPSNVINYPDRKRHSPCNIPSTDPSAEKYPRMINDQWRDPRFTAGQPTFTKSTPMMPHCIRAPVHPESRNNSSTDRTVAVVPPVMMSTPVQIDRWLIPKQIQPQSAEKQSDAGGMYHKWKLPLLAGAVLTRPSVRPPLILNPPQQLPQHTLNNGISRAPLNLCPANCTESHHPQFTVNANTNNGFPPSQQQSNRAPQTLAPASIRGQSIQLGVSSPQHAAAQHSPQRSSVLVSKNALSNHSTPEPPSTQDARQQTAHKSIDLLQKNISNITAILDQEGPSRDLSPQPSTSSSDLEAQPFLKFKPTVKAKRVEKGIRVKWAILKLQTNELEQVKSYQLFARQEKVTSSVTGHWTLMSLISALPSPMGCTLSKFIPGYRYYFRVRPIIRGADDDTTHEGPFSEVASIVFE